MFDIGARIVTLLYSDSERTKISPENLATDGARPRVGPCLIHPGPVLSIEVLTEGEPKLGFKDDDHPLKNITVRGGAAEDRRVRKRQAVVIGGAMAVVLIGLVILLLKSGLEESAIVGPVIVAVFALLAPVVSWQVLTSAPTSQKDRHER